MRIVEWAEVKTIVQEKLQSHLRALENCPHEEIERHRGRIDAYRSVLNIEASQPINSGSATFIRHTP